MVVQSTESNLDFDVSDVPMIRMERDCERGAKEVGGNSPPVPAAVGTIPEEARRAPARWGDCGSRSARSRGTRLKGAGAAGCQREHEEGRQGQEARPREAAQPGIITGKLTLTLIKGGDLKEFLETYFLEATQRGHQGRPLQLQLEQFLPEKLRKAVATHARTAGELDPEDGAFQQNVTEILLTSFNGTSTGNPADMYLRTFSTRRWQMRQERIEEFALDMVHTYCQYSMAKGWDVAESRRNELLACARLLLMPTGVTCNDAVRLLEPIRSLRNKQSRRACSSVAFPFGPVRAGASAAATGQAASAALRFSTTDVGLSATREPVYQPDRPEPPAGPKPALPPLLLGLNLLAASALPLTPGDVGLAAERGCKPVATVANVSPTERVERHAPDSKSLSSDLFAPTVRYQYRDAKYRARRLVQKAQCALEVYAVETVTLPPGATKIFDLPAKFFTPDERFRLHVVPAHHRVELVSPYEAGQTQVALRNKTKKRIVSFSAAAVILTVRLQREVVSRNPYLTPLEVDQWASLRLE
ncbi:MAG: hypothetical protein BJ554DRAFT_5782, partial [Olpidium bornovanus]